MQTSVSNSSLGPSIGTGPPGTMSATAVTGTTSALTRGPGGEPARGYATLTRLYHPKLTTQQLGSFFKLCRLQGVSFDLRSKTGTVFNVVDSLSSGLVAVVTVAPGAEQVSEGRRTRAILWHPLAQS